MTSLRVDATRPAVKHGAKQATVDPRLAHDQRVLLVVATVYCNGDDKVLSSRQLPEFEVVHGVGLNERLLGIVQDVSQGVDAHLEICGIDTHCLLAHG